jgi:lysophospholipid acyltransferase (LPLAT)-like uncharacterized protein
MEKYGVQDTYKYIITKKILHLIQWSFLLFIAYYYCAKNNKKKKKKEKKEIIYKNWENKLILSKVLYLKLNLS